MLGYVHFDRPGIPNNRVEVLTRRDRVADLRRNMYVRICEPEDREGCRDFLGRLVEGPFFYPEEIGRDSAIAQTAILRGDDFPAIPEYFAVAGVEILGELQGDRVLGSSRRPSPQARVHELNAEEVSSLLDVEGELFVGTVEGYPQVRVNLKATDKSVLPRNVGIFGTVGSGKTNTAQCLIEEVAAQNWAVVVLDVEGEYVAMDQPTKQLRDELRALALKPAGLPSFAVYYPANTETSRSGDKTAFSVRTSDVAPLVLCELIDAAEAQERRLLDVIEHLSRAARKKQPSTKTLEAALGADLAGPYTLRGIVDTIDEWVDVGMPGRGPATGADRNSYLALRGKLSHLTRSGVFDVSDAPPVNAQALLQAGRVSIVDLSGASDRVKNVVIADLLGKVFEAKLTDTKAELPRSLVIIEEAHSFVSRDKQDKMQETLETLREIARRGRKRWLGLGFISQQPSHLPNEIFELCNTRIVHTIKSEPNLRALKLTSGDISEEMWNSVPSLGIGQAVLSSPQLREPIVVNIRPCKTRRQLVE